MSNSTPLPQLPIEYQETSVMGVACPAPTKRLQQMTPDDLRVVEIWPGRAPVAVICFDYTATDIGPYGELGVCWPVVKSRRTPPPLLPLLLEQRWPNMGYWVHRLPVTTEIARRAGRELWGYPKFVADIDFAWSGRTRTCALAEGGAQILEVSIDTFLPAEPQRFSLRTFSARDDELLTTEIAVEAVGVRTRRSAGAQLSFGPHPVGRELVALGLDADRIAEVRWFPTWRAVLPRACARTPLSRPFSASPDANVRRGTDAAA